MPIFLMLNSFINAVCSFATKNKMNEIIITDKNDKANDKRVWPNKSNKIKTKSRKWKVIRYEQMMAIYHWP